MSEWKTTTIAEGCITFRSGGTPTAGWSEYYGGVIPFVTIEDMTACNKHLSSTRKTITEAGLSASAAWLVPSQHLLYSMYATLGKTRINTLPVATNQAIAAILPNPKRFDLLFLYYALSNLEHQVHRFTSQTTQANLNASIVKSFEIDHPSNISEQKKIARILTTVDNLIEKTEELIEKYKAIKQGMMHDLFTRGVDQHGKLRPPYEEAPHLYKESPLGWIPKEWDASPLSQYAVVSGGVTLGRKHSDVSTVELPYLRVANVQDGYIDFTEIKTIEVLQSEVQRYALEVGDILMTEGGDFDKLGRGTIWLGQISPCLHQNHIFRVRPNPESLDSYFLAAITSSAYGRHYFLMCAKQTTNLASINSTQVKAFPLLLPSLTEQKQIAERLRSIDSQILSEQEQQEKVQLLKTALMQDLLTGKVRVKVDETEEELTNA